MLFRSLDKNAKTITLADGSKLVSIGNCDVDNPEVDLTLNQYDVNGYIDSNHDLCFVIKANNKQFKFRITEDEMNARPKGINSCGGAIYSN